MNEHDQVARPDGTPPDGTQYGAAPADAASPSEAASASLEPDVREATVRRAPKWSVFIVLGLLLGLLGTIAVTTAFPADPNIGMGMTVFIVGLFGVPAGAALGAIAALIADRVSRRRTRTVTVERGAVHAEPEPDAEAAAAPDAAAEPKAATAAAADPELETAADPGPADPTAADAPPSGRD